MPLISSQGTSGYRRRNSAGTAGRDDPAPTRYVDSGFRRNDGYVPRRGAARCALLPGQAQGMSLRIVLAEGVVITSSAQFITPFNLLSPHLRWTQLAECAKVNCRLRGEG